MIDQTTNESASARQRAIEAYDTARDRVSGTLTEAPLMFMKPTADADADRSPQSAAEPS